ncbi:MAG: hypothetical protein JO261_03995 [Alphaproteobacteria bacterium]|nr:hypothetical protein [Alphaproteobacteria bacterium]MBV9692843.1 hypothetical protein [Alphaproteobacteria bacterium]
MIGRDKRGVVLALGFAVAAALSSASAQASMIVSSDPTANVSCAAGVCSATAADAVLNVNDLAAMLASQDVRLVPGNLAQDIEIGRSFSWVSPNRLDLDAYRSLIVAKNVTVAGPGALSIETNDGGKGGILFFSGTGHVEFWDLTSGLTIQGNSYALVKTLKQLIRELKHVGYVALANGIDAGKAGAFHGSAVDKFPGGTIAGMGNQISNFTVSECVCGGLLGFFGQIAHGATVRDLRLINVNVDNGNAINGWTGGLVGKNSGTVDDVYVSGFVKTGAAYGTAGLAGFSHGLIVRSASDASVSSGGNSGSLVGQNEGDIRQSFATGQVAATSYGAGFVSVNRNGSIEQSYSTGEVNGNGFTGGFVALNKESSTISDSYATNNVDGQNDRAGGFVVQNDGLIVRSYASGNVSALGGGVLDPPIGGGFAAFNRYGEIDDSFATGTVQSLIIAGGVVGLNSGWFTNRLFATIRRTFFTGKVIGVAGLGQAQVGGVVGQNDGGVIADSYSMGELRAPQSSLVGGVVAWNQNTLHAVSSISNCYAAGPVDPSPGSYIGGVIGYDYNPGTTQSCYWDLQTTGISNPAQGAGNVANDTGLTGLSTAQFQSGLPTGFDPSIWAQSPAINNGYPYLISVPPPGSAAKAPSLAVRFSPSFRTNDSLRRKFLAEAPKARTQRR